MAPPNSAVALLFAFAVVLAAALQPSDAIRVQAVSKPADQEAVQPSTWPGFPNIPGLPPLFPGFPPLPPLPSFPPLPGCPPLPPLPGLPIKPPQSGSPATASPLAPLPAASPPSSAASPPPSASLPGTPSSPATSPPPAPHPPVSPSTPAASPPPAPHPPVFPSTPAASPPPSPSQPTECLSSLMGLMPCMGYLTNTTVLSPPAKCCDGFKSLVGTAPICLCHGMNGDINKLMPAPMDFMRMMSLPTSCAVPLPLQTLAQCNTVPVPPLTMPPSPPAAPAPKPSQ